MKEIPVYEAKTRLSELLAEVEHGEQFTITRRGRPVARLVGLGAARSDAVGQRQHVVATIGALRRQRQGVVLDGDTRELSAGERD